MVGLLTFGISETVYSFLSVALGIIGVLIARPNASVDLPLSKFGTKTAYRHCGLQPIIDPAHERSKQCRMVYVAGLFRHGTRAPSPSEITHIRDLYERLSSCQEAALPKNFLSHPIPFQNARGYELLPRGRQELYNLGRSFRKRVTSHFRVTRSNSLFYSSSSERAIHSAWSFYKGLFKLEPAKWDGYTAFEVNDTQSVIQVEDELLRFFETCERHAKQIRRGESSMKEYRKFLHGPQMHHMLQDIMKKHNIRCANLSTTDLTTLFVTCAHEVAVNSTIPISPWCGFFNAESLDILEYLGDLKQYWQWSHAYELNHLQSCPLLSRIMDDLKLAASQHVAGNKTMIRGSFWFGHAETLLPVVTHLGLFNESTGTGRLVASDFEERLGRIKLQPSSPTTFRSGFISPFAGNLAFVLHHCASTAEHSDDPIDGFFVELLMNEITVAWPFHDSVSPSKSDLSGSTFVPLRTVLDHLRRCAPDTYDKQKYCSL